MKRVHTLRYVLAATLILGIYSAGVQSVPAVQIQVDLNSDLDRFGSQIETIQVYQDASGDRVAYGIYDTGASVITWSALDQDGGIPIPIKVPDGAEAEGIGGTLTGDVSQPGTVLAVGVEALQYTSEFPFIDIDVGNAAFVPGDPNDHGVQLFVGTHDGSPYLPTITGTPIHNGRLPSFAPDVADGIAAKINMQYGIDLGQFLIDLGFPDFAESFEGIILPMPNIEFVPPGMTLQAVPDDVSTPLNESTTEPVRIPMALYGMDNHADPGETITASHNPFQNTGVVLSDGGVTIGDDPDDRLAMLFD
ncbi:MAG: hypothetical protein ACYSWU_12155, partial [Planctomycetota bacterium]